MILLTGALASCAPVTVNIDIPAEPIAAGSSATAYVTLTCSGGDAATLLDVRVAALTEGLSASPSSKTISENDFSGTTVTTTYQLTASSAQTYDFKILGMIQGEATPIDSTHSVTFSTPSSVFSVSYSVSPEKDSYWVDEDDITVTAQITYLGSGSTLAPVEFSTGTGITQSSGTFSYSSYNFSNSTPTANFEWIVQPSSTTVGDSYIEISDYQTEVTEIKNVVDPTTSVSSVAPAAGSSTTDTTPTVTFTVSDDDNSTVSCTLYFNGAPRGVNSSCAADGSTINQITAAPSLDYSQYTWYVSCTDGSHTGVSSTRSLRVYQSTTNEGSGPGGGSYDAPPGSEFETTYTPEQNVSYFEDLINNDENVNEALENALGHAPSQTQISEIAELSAQLASDFKFTTNADHVGNGSQLTLNIEYTGEETLDGVVVIFTVPKSFAATASEITLTFQPALSENNILILEEDPMYSFNIDTLGAEEILEFFFDVGVRVNRNTVKANMTGPTVLIQGIKEQTEPEQPTPICGNGILEEGEECDGPPPEDLDCINCKLVVKEQPEPEEIPEVEPVPEPEVEPEEPEQETGLFGPIVAVMSGIIILVLVLAVVGIIFYAKVYSKKQEKKKKKAKPGVPKL